MTQHPSIRLVSGVVLVAAALLRQRRRRGARSGQPKSRPQASEWLAAACAQQPGVKAAKVQLETHADVCNHAGGSLQRPSTADLLAALSALAAAAAAALLCLRGEWDLALLVVVAWALNALRGLEVRCAPPVAPAAGHDRRATGAFV
jgi:hypothetical protein